MAEMLRKYLVIPVVLLGLGIAFVILDILLSISRGNDSLLRKKLRIGGLILALQGLAVQTAWTRASCYERILPEFLALESASEPGVISVNLEETNEISATIKFGDRLEFSFAVVQGDALIQSGAVLPADGRMDSSDEQVIIPLDSSKVSTGSYELRILWNSASGTNSILKATALKRYQLRVRDE